VCRNTTRRAGSGISGSGEDRTTTPDGAIAPVGGHEIRPP
jgi:hypothetical protein